MFGIDISRFRGAKPKSSPSSSGTNTPAVKPPVMIFQAQGLPDDEIDAIRMAESFENPERWEDTIRTAISDARTQPEVAELLKKIHLQEDRAEAFESFCSASHIDPIANFMARFGITKTSSICDLGCGPGQMSYALKKRGYEHLCAMDPNGEWYTGTGYLKSIAGDSIEVFNSLDRWRTVSNRFDAVISTATIHHWQHIPLVAIDTRRTMKPGAFWFAFAEFFANSPHELVSAINGHLTATRYGSYEWAYPASVYADLIQSVGFNLIAVVPYFYKNNELTGVMRDPPSDIDFEALNRSVDEGLVSYGGTVDRFWDEVDRFRRQGHGHRIYTEPQALVFQRIGS